MIDLELEGVISKLEDGFAYAKTDIGSVYIPIQCARSKTETLASLRDKFAYQDKVMLTVIEQHGKNSCKYVARKIKKIHEGTGRGTPIGKEVLSPEVHGPITAKITSTTDSYAFAHNEDDFGTVFIPGEAFDSTKVRCVKRYVIIGDVMILKVKRQKSQNGCSWVAVNAEKHFSLSEEQNSMKIGDTVISFGMVIEVQATHVDVWDEKNCLMITCPQLTYVGGLRGRSAKSLLDLIQKDDSVMFKAVVSDNGVNEALEWKQVGESGATLEVPKKVETQDAYTQTCPEVANLILKSILRDNPSIAEKFANQLNLLPRSALPDHCLLAEVSKDFDGWPT